MPPTLIRLQLRAAVVQALTDTTMAGPLVFDSKMDPLISDESEVTVPAIIVYTDTDAMIRPSTGEGGVKFAGRHVDVVIEMAVATINAKGFTLASGDPELEAVLDILEWQVWQALTNPYAEASKAFRALARQVPEYSSVPGRAADQANRVAMRQLTMTVQVPLDCGVLATTGALPPVPGSASSGAPGTPGGGAPLLLFGVPYLSALEQRLQEEPDLAAVADQLRAAVTGTPSVSLPVLERIAAGYYTAEPGIDPATGRETLIPAKGSRVPINIKP